MPLYKNDHNKLVLFIHIPKTGGTSIEGKLINYPCAFFNRYKGELKVTPQHFTFKDYCYLGLDLFVDNSFCIVRDPFDRLLSEYKYRMGNSKFLYKFFDFPTFVFFVKRKGVDTCYFDNHLRAQKSFYFSGVKVFKFEDGFESIGKELKEEFYFSNLTSENIHKKKSNVKKMKPFSFIRRHVFEIYESDYVFFDYDFEDKCYENEKIIEFFSFLKSFFWRFGFFLVSKLGL